MPKLATNIVKIHIASTILGPSSTQKSLCSRVFVISHSSAYEAGAMANQIAVPIVYVTNNSHAQAIAQKLLPLLHLHTCITHFSITITQRNSVIHAQAKYANPAYLKSVNIVH